MRNFLFIVFILVSVVCNGGENYLFYFHFLDLNYNHMTIKGDTLIVGATKFTKDKIIYSKYTETRKDFSFKRRILVSDTIDVNQLKKDFTFAQNKYDEWKKVCKKEFIVNSFRKEIISNDKYSFIFVNNDFDDNHLIFNINGKTLIEDYFLYISLNLDRIVYNKKEIDRKMYLLK